MHNDLPPADQRCRSDPPTHVAVAYSAEDVATLLFTAASLGGTNACSIGSEQSFRVTWTGGADAAAVLAASGISAR
jgi:hypothetical protein